MLRELDVLVLDCQASGATPAHGDLLELGWELPTDRLRVLATELRRVADHGGAVAFRIGRHVRVGPRPAAPKSRAP